MHDLKVWQLTGWFGLVGFFLFVSQIPLYLVGSPVPPMNDAIVQATASAFHPETRREAVGRAPSLARTCGSL